MACYDHIEIDDETVFKESEWIGIGKQYPKDPPQYVTDAKERVLQVPKHFQRRYPKDTLPVSQFLALRLPEMSYEIIPVKDTSWFSTEVATTDPSCLLTRPIPNTQYLKQLERAFSQAWFDGAKSIVDSRYNDGHDRLPLWAISFWKTLTNITNQQQRWNKSQLWLERQKGNSLQDKVACSVIDQAFERFRLLGWNTRLPYLRNALSTALFANLLSTDWLNDDHVNMMMEEITNELTNTSRSSPDTVIAPLGFSAEIMANGLNGIYQRKRGAGILCRYEKHIKEHSVKKLYAPVHVNNNHWIVVCIDFGQGKISDSLGMNHGKFMKYLHKWLQIRFNIDPAIEGNTLPCGVQTDSHSCGILTANTIEHNVFGRDLCTSKSALRQRIEWFLRLSKPINTKMVVEMEEANTKPKTETMSLAAEFELVNNVDLNLALATGDHNFPDLPKFLLDSTAEDKLPSTSMPPNLNPAPQKRLGLFDLLNGDSPGCSLEMASTTNMSGSMEQINETGPTPGTDMESHYSRNSISETDTSISDSSDSSGEDSSSEDGKSKHTSISPETSEEMDGDTPNGPKRTFHQRSPATSEDDVTDSEKRKLKKPRPGFGKSKSARASLANRQKFRDGTFDLSNTKLTTWRNKILEDDRHAEFKSDNICSVRHSGCGRFFQVKEPYDLTRWRAHLKGCGKMEESTKSGKSRSLFAMGWFTNSQAAKKKHIIADKITSQSAQRPCPGLAEADNEHIPVYLRRTAASGGGGKSVHLVAKRLFNTLFSKLSKQQKEEVFDAQKHGHLWKNDHQRLKVFATSCQGLVPDRAPNRPLPCPPCDKVLRSKRFKTALRKKTPLAKNQIFTNKQFRNQVLGEIYARVVGLKDIIENPNSKKSPCVRYAQGVLNGKYDDKVFSGLVEAMVQKHDREQCGTGLQNFRYAPAWDEFCHTLSIESPRAYRAIRKHFPAPSERTFRQREGRQPRFPQEICEKSFALVNDHLMQISYLGPCSLSCDDTKLFSTFRLYWDSEKQAHFLVGGVDGPMKVVDPENMRALIDSSKSKKAVKVRLWCLTLAIPKISPIIVAALPIPNDLNAQALAPLSLSILEGLISLKIKVVSYACDGTEVERAVQRILTEKARSHLKYDIKNPQHGAADIDLTIPVIKGQPVCMIQDSKHALKTLRNNLFSGARALVFGNYPAFYAHIRELAMEDKSPLYLRDVEKLDRQDDNAATRLFSSETLRYLCDNHPNYVGEIVYLFVFGELIDAYQNRSITHTERVKLVLRARYFLDSWLASLAAVGYPKTYYAVSREALDIMRVIIDGYLSLVIVHRDHVEGVAPLLPWLHSSEACEHVFGEARQIVKDFSMLDFLYMIPKLRVKIRHAILEARASDPKSRASGYAHTYFDLSGLNELNLATFPSDFDIGIASDVAADEAGSLFNILGISAQRLRRVLSATPQLPSIDAWFKHDDGLVEEDPDGASIYSDDDSEPSEGQQLQQFLDHEEDITLSRTQAQETALLNLTCASLALKADDMIKVQTLAGEDLRDSEVAELEQVASEEYLELQAATGRIADLVLEDQASKPLGRGTIGFQHLDFNSMVEARREHETRQAVLGVRTKGTASTQSTKATIRQQLIRRFHEVLKECQDDIAIGTGLERGARWKVSAKGGQTGGERAPSGNTANAIAVAADVLKRRKIYTDHKVPELSYVSAARVSLVRHLLDGDYAFVFLDNEIRVGKVLTMYSRSGGKNGKNEWVSASSNISAISKLLVQVFEFNQGRQFTSRTLKTSPLDTYQFALIPSFAVLCLLLSRPININASGFDLSLNDMKLYKSFEQGLSSFTHAMKTFRKRTPAD